MSHNDSTRGPVAAGTAESRNLKRSLSHGQMTMIVMGSALGTGLFWGRAPRLPWPVPRLF